MADRNKPGITKDSQIEIDVPQNTLTTLTNQTINNTGHFEFVPPNGADGLSLVSGTVDMTPKILQNLNWEPTGLPSTFRISDFNQANNTDYIGVREITCLDTNIQPQQAQIIINNISTQDIDNNYVTKVAINGRFTIPDQIYTYLFLTLYNGYYYFKLYLKTTSSSVNITNNSGNVMRVFRIYQAASPVNFLFRYYDGSNYTNIINTRTIVVGISSSTSINSLTTCFSFNQSYYDMSSFF